MYVIQRLENVLFAGQIDVVASANGTSLATALATAGFTLTSKMSGISLTDNDASATIYVAFDDNVASTYFYKSLTPSAPYFEDLLGLQPARNVYLRSSSGTVKCHVTVFGS